ncbi:MAG: bifunctional demethylmenaquinone methyltransferase/2-methoxy-6-polyprenyl-1,4-benzoquinol methylase UbiE [Sphingomonas sp.]|nr:MAG: bifunctional demethylmenaquinone methyltransferase/2-methoxy-6-polyprenyl-1,4-benzoquinol methylase UbiE [Sphingomonas sp.]
MADTEQLVSLGFRDVAPEEKTRAVGDIFRRVASRYDLMNDLMSGGLHRLWKDEFVKLLKPQPHENILDLAGGTGDIAFRIAKRGASVTVADINPGMLGVGRERAEKRGLSLDFVEANAEEMPFADAGFDAVTIAFGIRNVTDIPKALRDIRRVLKWGGRFYCLEFSASEWPGFAKLYDEYTLKLVPKVGAVVADDEEAYRYLAESIKRFPPMPAFAKMIEEAGFKQVKARPILGGAVAIHSGWKI